jgi:molybdopterin molybdotransferase
MSEPSASTSLQAAIASCLSDYDPNALPVEDAKRIIGSFLAPVADAERLAVRAALGRVLAEDIVATLNVPAHDNSAMDGYAVRGADLSASGETRLKRIGEAFAGRAFAGAIGPGECVRVMTGAVMPKGTDTVVVQEITREDGAVVIIPAGPKAGENMRFAGEDLAIGKVAIPAGRLVRPQELGLIASMGIGEVMVKRKLRVAFFSTGDELASIGQPLREGQVYDSNRYTLFGMLERLGVEVTDLGVVRDDPATIERALLEAASKADAVITSGGVSVGEADFIRGLLARLGEVVFWKIAMRPGRPMAFGRIGHGANAARFFGLPGNPVAVMVTFYHFVRDALLAMSGRTDEVALPTLQAPCLTPLRKKPGRTEYQRGVLARDADGRWSVRITGQQGSGVLRSMSEANCFIVLEHERGSVNAGDLVTVQLFEGLV